MIKLAKEDLPEGVTDMKPGDKCEVCATLTITDDGAELSDIEKADGYEMDDGDDGEGASKPKKASGIIVVIGGPGKE